MANTYTLIESQVLGSSAPSVTFSAIPATYTDLVLRLSVRYDGSLVYGSTEIKLNSDTASNYSRTTLRGDGSSAVSERGSSNSILIFPRSITGDTATANTFSNSETYIPNYTSSNYKSMSNDAVTENNATSALNSFFATLWSDTAAVTSITLAQDTGISFAEYSTATLYGIKNS